MENTRFWVQQKGHSEKDSLSEESSISQLKKLVKRANSHEAIIVNIIQSQNSNFSLKDLFFLLVHGHYRIPKHMASADETYVRQCLEFLHISALNASQYNTPMLLGSKTMFTSAESLSSAKIIGGHECGSCQLVFGHLEATVTESAVTTTSTNATKKCTLEAVMMRSRSMVNILNSPLFQQFGASERNNNLNRTNFTDARNMMCHDFTDSPGGFSISSSPIVQSPKYGSISVHKRITSSTSSTNSNWLSSASSTQSKGMFQCTWKQGVPHFVFSADDQKEVYVAKLSKVDTKEVEDLDYVYLFHLNKGGQKGPEISSDSELKLVGKMNVSTSFTLGPDNRRIMETQFILFGNTKIYDKEMYPSSHFQWKTKGLSKKVAQVFKTSPSSKQRTLSQFNESNAIIESCPWEPQSGGLVGTSLLEANVPPNFELAAIVVKDHLPFHCLDKVGGWGLKFLNKSKEIQTILPSECYGRNTGDCSTSMSILIPAGMHGGPRTRHIGPSSLIDRWRSGGCCDCGGWDEGCPLTVLQRRSSNAEVRSQVDIQGECKSIDLVTQGSRNFSPTLRMVNIRDGLYFIHFQPSLSALQSFSIAVAIIHMQSPTLRPDSAQELC